MKLVQNFRSFKFIKRNWNKMSVIGKNLRKLRLKIAKLFEKLRLGNCLAIAYFLAQSQPDCL